MKYETPELTALTPAVNAIQGLPHSKGFSTPEDGSEPQPNEAIVGYADWE